jgi:hypothetical protein
MSLNIISLLQYCRRFQDFFTTWLYLICWYSAKALIKTIHGHTALFISPLHLLGPVIGKAGLRCLAYTAILQSCFALTHYNSYPLSYSGIAAFLTALHAPSLIAALCFTRYKGIAVLLAAVCAPLFWLHPQGTVAWPFALYFLVPLLLSASKRSNPAIGAVQTAFTAHAVGAVLCIWRTNKAAYLWVQLIPLVIFERFLIACSLWAFDRFGRSCLLGAKRFAQRLFTSSSIHTFTGHHKI